MALNLTLNKEQGTLNIKPITTTRTSDCIKKSSEIHLPLFRTNLNKNTKQSS